MKILLLIDIQKEYSPQGNLSLLNYEKVVNDILFHIENHTYDKIILIKHVNSTGLFSSENSNIDKRFLNFNFETVIKNNADSFQNTDLLPILQRYNNPNIYICGMMTQNCVTYTALTSKMLNYNTYVYKNLCTTTDETIHTIAIKALASKSIKII